MKSIFILFFTTILFFSAASEAAVTYLVDVKTKLNVRDPNRTGAVIGTFNRAEEVKINKKKLCRNYKSEKMVYVTAKKLKGCVSKRFLVQKTKKGLGVEAIIQPFEINWTVSGFMGVDQGKLKIVPLLFFGDSLHKKENEKICKILRCDLMADSVGISSSFSMKYSQAAKILKKKPYKHLYFFNIDTGKLSLVEWNQRVQAYSKGGFRDHALVLFLPSKFSAEKGYVFATSRKLKVKSLKLEDEVIVRNKKTTKEDTLIEAHEYLSHTSHSGIVRYGNLSKWSFDFVSLANIDAKGVENKRSESMYGWQVPSMWPIVSSIDFPDSSFSSDCKPDMNQLRSIRFASTGKAERFVFVRAGHSKCCDRIGAAENLKVKDIRLMCMTSDELSLM